MYHDQGQIAMKLMGFEKGVTLHGGQPKPIATPAHGTAFDIEAVHLRGDAERNAEERGGRNLLRVGVVPVAYRGFHLLAIYSCSGGPAMRRIILLSLFALLMRDASAQHRSTFGAGSARRSFAPGGARQGQSAVRGAGFSSGLSLFPYGFSYVDGYLPYDSATPYGYPLPPNFIIVQPPPSPAVVQEPPGEAPAVIHEYPQPLPGPSAQGELPTFGIILKDGSVRSASAVFVTNNVLHYVDPEEKNLRISMDEVDREATLKLNRERKLNLWLPATPPMTAATPPSR